MTFGFLHRDKRLFPGFVLMIGLLFVQACGDKPGIDEKKKHGDTIRVDLGGRKNIVFFGNSITAGYGLEPTEAFPALIQDRVDSLNLPYDVVNAGVSGETSSGGNSRIDWVLRTPVDVFVLELGGNDGLRGIPVAETERNLQSIMDKVKAKWPEARIILAGMQVPPNMGQRYAGDFREMYARLAAKNQVALIPFLLEGVGGEARLNLEDGIHPTAEGHQILANNVWKVMRQMLDY